MTSQRPEARPARSKNNDHRSECADHRLKVVQQDRLVHVVECVADEDQIDGRRFELVWKVAIAPCHPPHAGMTGRGLLSKPHHVWLRIHGYDV